MMTRHFFLLALVLLATPLMHAKTAVAQAGELIGASGDWQAYRVGSGDATICFITSTPTQLEGNYDRNNRGETRVYVTHFQGDDEERGVVSSVAGYRFKEAEEVSFAIDGTVFTLFSDGTRAYANDGQDGALVAAMKRGNRLKVTGISSRGNTTIDTYSLAGFTRAMGIIDGACQ